MREEGDCFHGKEDASRNVDLGIGLGWTSLGSIQRVLEGSRPFLALADTWLGF